MRLLHCESFTYFGSLVLGMDRTESLGIRDSGFDAVSGFGIRDSVQFRDSGFGIRSRFGIRGVRGFV